MPVALTWVGAGAVAAFDGLALALFLVLRPDGSEAGWGVSDTVLVVKVVIGVVAGVVLALVVTAAARDNQRPVAGVHTTSGREAVGASR